MRRMVGECYKTKRQVSDSKGRGRRIKETVMGERSQSHQSMKEIL